MVRKRTLATNEYPFCVIAAPAAGECHALPL
jgi:hypothetical protein